MIAETIFGDKKKSPLRGIKTSTSSNNPKLPVSEALSPCLLSTEQWKAAPPNVHILQECPFVHMIVISHVSTMRVMS
jgi:hypothetical protein